MNQDSVNKLLNQWSKKRPSLDTSSLGVAVRIDRLSAELSQSANCALEPLGLAMWEYDVLSTLRRQPAPHELAASKIADETRMSTGAITHRVTRLVDRGLLRRRRDSEDRRTVLVSLTDNGLEQVDEALETRVEAVAESLSVLSERERRTLNTILGKWLADSESPAA